MNNFNQGKMITNYIEEFSENLDESVVFKSIIDFKFETQTFPYMVFQFVIYIFMFVIPYFFITFTNLNRNWLGTCIYMSLFGVTFMFTYEFMGMKVQGIKVYFSSPWNWFDTITPIVYIILSKINLSIAEHPDADNHDLIEWRRVLNTIMLTSIWFKMTWYQKLNPDLGLMQQLLLGVLRAFLPFIVIYLFWVIFFALNSIVLGNNESLAKSYTGTGLL